MAEVNQTHPGNPVNEEQPKVRLNYSRYFTKYHLFQTHRFGEYTPFYVANTIAKDHNDFQNVNAIRSYNMVSPKLQTLNVKKDYFNVPYECILPRNWDKIFSNPLQGEEAPKNAHIVVENFTNKLKTNLGQAWTNVMSIASTADSDDNPGAILQIVKMLLTTELFCSNGSLLKNLGYSYNNLFYFTGTNTDGEYITGGIDKLIDIFVLELKKAMNAGSISSQIGVWNAGTGWGWYIKGEEENTRRFFEILRQYPSSTLDFQYLDTATKTAIENFCKWFATNISVHFKSTRERPQKFDRCAAYHLVCAHFYTNDHTDYIYSAELYRQVMQHHIKTSDGAFPTFTMNGLTYEYDALSGKCIEIALDNIFMGSVDAGAIEYLFGLFSFNNSLRYVDYFTGAKTQPLAIGATDVNVVSNKVSVIDITKNIQLQRYLMAANRAGAKIESYIQGIFNVKPAYDFHNPEFLAHETNTVSGTETENTGTEQLTLAQTTTSTFRDSGITKIYSYYPDRPGVIIGIQYYDYERVYKQVTERCNFHTDRFDMFNPVLQYTGDQEIYSQELNFENLSDNFGYETRYNEYRQRVSQAAGGFIDELKSWIYEADEGEKENEEHISPDYIRSSSTEFDKFFKILTGYSLGTYWHFIVSNENIEDFKRPMEETPGIL